MADKKEIIKERLENEGLVDFKDLYQLAHTWLKEKGFVVAEEKYGEKVSGDMRDIKVEWTASKTVSDYFKIEVKIKYELKDMVDVEVEMDGVKKKMNKGRLKIDYKGNLIKDPNSKWSTTPFYRFLRDTYNKFVIPARIENMEDQVFNLVVDLKEEMKAQIDTATGR